MATTHAVTVPAEADAAAVIGNGPTRYGVVAAVGDEVRVLPISDEWADVLANIVRNLRGSGNGPTFSPVEFVRVLPRKLRWYTWARAVEPGTEVSPLPTPAKEPD